MAAVLLETDSTPKESLRVRKARMTYRTIASAALSLTTELGLPNVTVELIAERAFVSPRTVSNYFASKEAALLAAFDTDCDDLFAAIAGRPAEEHPLRSVQAALTADVRSWDDAHLAVVREREVMLGRYPAVAALQLGQLERLGVAIRSMLAMRAGDDPYSELASQLAAGMTVMILKTTTGRWNEMPGDALGLAALLDDAFDEAALAAPPR